MDRYQLTKRVAVLGILANLLLLGFKLFIGFISRSQAMIADGFNSAGDVFASVMTYAGNRISSQPEDHDHPFGHGKAEYIFSMIISFSLLLVAYKVLRDSLDALLNKSQFNFSWGLIAVAVGTIITKLALFFYTRSAGRKHENLLILANSEDHRNDVFVTLGTLLSIVLGTFGVFWVDGVVGTAISLWIGFTGFRIFISAYRVLMDTNIDKQLREKIWKMVESVKGVDHVDEITAKPIGVGFVVIVKVSVRGDMTVDEGHGVAARIKSKLKECSEVGDVIVHVNPA